MASRPHHRQPVATVDVLDMDPVKAEQEVAAGTRISGRARISAPRTMVRHVEVLGIDQRVSASEPRGPRPLPADHHLASLTPTRCPKSPLTRARRGRVSRREAYEFPSGKPRSLPGPRRAQPATSSFVKASAAWELLRYNLPIAQVSISCKHNVSVPVVSGVVLVCIATFCRNALRVKLWPTIPEVITHTGLTP